MSGMLFRIVTEEPLDRWCKPLHEGQVIEVVEYDPDPSPTNTGDDTTIHRYIAYANPAGELLWEKVARNYVLMKGPELTKVYTEDPLHTSTKKAKKKR